MPRKMKVEFDKVIEAIKKYENTIFQGGNIVGPTHPIWSEIQNNLNREISTKSLYTIVKCDRNDILNKLNIKSSGHVSQELVSDCNTENESDDNEDIENIVFKITLSKEEWNSIKCKKKNIKNKT